FSSRRRHRRLVSDWSSDVCSSDLPVHRYRTLAGRHDPAGIVASGERAVAVDGGDYYYYQMKKKGNPIEVVYPKEGVPLVVSPTRSEERRVGKESRSRVAQDDHRER